MQNPRHGPGCPGAGLFFEDRFYYFFFGAAFFTGAAPHGVVFRPSIFAFSASIVSMNGSLTKADGTPLNWTSVPVSGFPLSAASSLSVTSAWVGSLSAITSSFDRQAGLASTTVPFSGGTSALLS